MSTNKKILVIAKEDVVSSFRFLGVETLAVTDVASANDAFCQTKDLMDDYGVIYITEEFYPALKEEIVKLTNRTTPAIVIIPDNTGSKNIGSEIMRQAVERATGSNILS